MNAIRERTFRNLQEAADWVRFQPAPKFYISSKSLVNYIGAIANGAHLPNMYSQNRKKVRALYTMYNEFILRDEAKGLSRARICEILVDSPAPQFFIGHDSAVKVILNERKKAQSRIVREVSSWGC